MNQIVTLPDAAAKVPVHAIETWPVDRLKAYERNARKHPKKQIEQLRASFQKFGQVWPLLVRSDGTIIAGHGRIEAAKAEGLTEVRVIVASGWSEEQCRAFTLLDNKVALNSEWDEALLGVELAELGALGLDPSLMGFDPDEFAALTGAGGEGLTDPDEVPDPPVNPVSRVGDLWLLEKHRLLCGDSTRKEDVERLMGGQRADLIATDPPYGVSFERGKFVGREKAAKGPGFAPIANDKLQGAELTEFIRSALVQAFAVAKDAPVYCWSPSLDEGGAILAGVRAAGFKVQSQIIWRKTPFVIGRADYHWQHEVCWYGFKGKGHAWYGGRDKGTVWDCPKPQKVDLHPTMKPVQLYATAVENSSKGGDVVLDLFAGAGPLAIACEQSGRAAYMMECEPVYCDVIVHRWQDFSGQVAVDENGRAFAEAAAERVKEAA